MLISCQNSAQEDYRCVFTFREDCAVYSRPMPKSRPSPIVYVKSLPGSEDVWQYTSSNYQILCMTCEAGIPYPASNLKFRIEKHITSAKHEKKASQCVRQMTLAFTAQEMFGDLLHITCVAHVTSICGIRKIRKFSR